MGTNSLGNFDLITELRKDFLRMTGITFYYENTNIKVDKE